jgi:hypothetical protein
MVKFWVTFALIVAAIGALSQLHAFSFFNPFGLNLSVGSSSGGGERGSGVQKSEIRKVGAFSKVHAEGSGVLDIDVKTGNPGGTVEISADDNLLGFFSTQVVDGVLEIQQTASMSPRSRLGIRLAVPSLEAVHLEGANTLNLTIDSTGPLEVHLEGAGRVRASGKVGTLAVHSEGAGSVDASELVASTVEVTIEGAGKARVHASDTLKARIEGAGTIAYLGNPKTVERQIDGIGRISKAD